MLVKFEMVHLRDVRRHDVSVGQRAGDLAPVRVTLHQEGELGRSCGPTQVGVRDRGDAGMGEGRLLLAAPGVRRARANVEGHRA